MRSVLQKITVTCVATTKIPTRKLIHIYIQSHISMHGGDLTKNVSHRLTQLNTCSQLQLFHTAKDFRAGDSLEE